VHTVSILKEAEQPAQPPGMREALGEQLPWPEPGRGLLDRVADVSGGRTFTAQSFNELQSVFGRALDEMRSRYLLLFYPTEAKRAGWHEVKSRSPVATLLPEVVMAIWYRVGVATVDSSERWTRQDARVPGVTCGWSVVRKVVGMAGFEPAAP
jgi:hypothetical protein